MKRTRLTAIIMAATMAAAMLTGCGNGDAAVTAGDVPDGLEGTDPALVFQDGASSASSEFDISEIETEARAGDDIFSVLAHINDLNAYDYRAGLFISSADADMDLSASGSVDDGGRFGADIALAFKSKNIPDESGEEPEPVFMSTRIAFDGSMLYADISDILAGLAEITGEDPGISFDTAWVGLSMDYAGEAAGLNIDAGGISKSHDGKFMNACLEFMRVVINNMEASPLSYEDGWAIIIINSAARDDMEASLKKLVENGEADRLIEDIISAAAEYDPDQAEGIKVEWEEKKQDILNPVSEDYDIDGGYSYGGQIDSYEDMDIIIKIKSEDGKFYLKIDGKSETSELNLYFEKGDLTGEVYIPEEYTDLEAWMEENMAGYGDYDSNYDYDYNYDYGTEAEDNAA